MSIWLGAALGLLGAIVLCSPLLLRARPLTESLLALQMSGNAAVLILLLLAQAMHRPSFMDLALVLAVLQFPAGLLFAHILERWFL